MKYDKTEGLERVRKYEDEVLIAMQKILRPNNNLLKERDYAALEDLCKNLEEYLSWSMQTLEIVRRFL